MSPTRRKRRQRGTGSIERLPSGRYRGRWREGSRSRSHTADTEQAVLDYIEEARVDYRRRGGVPSSTERTLDDVATEWWQIVEHSVKPRTAERYDDHLRVIRQELGATPITSVDARALQLFVGRLQASYAPKTVRACHAVARLILAHAHRMGEIQAMPPKVILPRIQRPMLTIPSRDQVEALATASDARLWAVIILAGYCGLREGELLALQTTDVHLDDAVPWLLVRHARNKTSGRVESTKTDRVRRVYLPRRVVEALEQHVSEHPDDLVVPVTASVYQKSFERARKACNLTTVRPHDLRHAAASMMIAAGLNVLQVSKQLGHANPTQTLNTYGHLWPDSFDDAMQKMNTYLAA